MRLSTIDRSIPYKQQLEFFKLWWAERKKECLLNEESKDAQTDIEQTIEACRKIFPFLKGKKIETTKFSRLKIPDKGWFVINIQRGHYVAEKQMFLINYNLLNHISDGRYLSAGVAGGTSDFMKNPRNLKSENASASPDDIAAFLSKLRTLASLRVNDNLPVASGLPGERSNGQPIYGVRVFDDQGDLWLCSEFMAEIERNTHGLNGQVDSLDIASSLIAQETDSFLGRVKLGPQRPFDDCLDSLNRIVSPDNPVITHSDLQWITICAL
jgi:hypothetical protein